MTGVPAAWASAATIPNGSSQRERQSTAPAEPSASQSSAVATGARKLTAASPAQRRAHAASYAASYGVP